MDVLRIMIISVMILIWIGFLICMFLLYRNDCVLENRIIIIDALCDYHRCILEYGGEMLVTGADMETYKKTLRRFWDWGYTRILPHDKFEIIKDFIKK